MDYFLASTIWDHTCCLLDVFVCGMACSYCIHHLQSKGTIAMALGV